MLSSISGVMFKVKQLFTKNHLLLLLIALFLVHFISCVVFRSQSLNVPKSYQNNQVKSIKKLLGVPNKLNYSLSKIGRTNLIVHRDTTSYNSTSFDNTLMLSPRLNG